MHLGTQYQLDRQYRNEREREAIKERNRFRLSRNKKQQPIIEEQINAEEEE